MPRSICREVLQDDQINKNVWTIAQTKSLSAAQRLGVTTTSCRSNRRIAAWVERGFLLKPKFLWPFLCLPALLLIHNSATGEPRPSHTLKGITIIDYFVGVEKTLGGEQCKIDDGGLDIALQFVANQSTKLKIVTKRERERRGKELNEIEDQIWNKANGKVDDMVATMKDDKFLAARKAAHDYNLMPHLLIVIAPVEIAGGCAGSAH